MLLLDWLAGMCAPRSEQRTLGADPHELLYLGDLLAHVQPKDERRAAASPTDLMLVGSVRGEIKHLNDSWRIAGLFTASVGRRQSGT